MTWSDFYLICFVVGLLLSALSFVLGNFHLHIHLPFHFHFGHFHVGAPHAHGPAGGQSGLPAINFGTITAFLAWFGGVGYLLTRHSHLYAFTALGFAILGGLFGASVIFVVIGKVLMKHDIEMEPEDSDMVGVLGRIQNPIFEGGTGEIVYVHSAARHTCAARSEDQMAIAKGTEVVVTRYEKGIAYVRRWEEMAEENLGSRTAERSS